MSVPTLKLESVSLGSSSIEPLWLPGLEANRSSAKTSGSLILITTVRASVLVTDSTGASGFTELTTPER
jgi:hypothetical protein